eukprot:CAMPEP_0113681670 /NCGR_PEP_ID=MMETSP0038_2-20120614/12153_1 /TAXON_ID=2898 /ORGANISM="Cryptomonas paramecium" /LENGTH=57 /DNA_ID=CAMNT_0000600487 /DNA_START=1 /DNA_END=171 /DNA_ORIENTATION=- /assembly_acc=CAM_ASM_000170
MINRLQNRQGVALMSDEAIANVTAHNFQDGLARISLAVCRATAARLTGSFLEQRVHH